MPTRGEVWSANLEPIQGHEQAGTRPCLIVSKDRFNRLPMALVTIVPITSTNRGLAMHVPVGTGEGGLSKPSVIMPEHIRTISQSRLGRRYGAVSSTTLAEVEARLRSHLDL